MLKSTHKALNAPSPLAEGWTEHKAPTGHSYFYNPTTKESTYARPIANQAVPAGHETSLGNQLYHQSPSHYGFSPAERSGTQTPFRNGFPADLSGAQAPRVRSFNPRCQNEQRDRPKTKQPIAGCKPWVLVRTRLGRRFVHNPETQESFWRFPPDVMKAVIEHDRLEREKKLQTEKAEAKPITDGSKGLQGDGESETKSKSANVEGSHIVDTRPDLDGSEDEYEEVEVTDDEDEEGQNPSKRFKETDQADDKPVEFDEEDIAYQLAAMGEDDGLDPPDSEMDDEAMDDDEEPPLTEEDSTALFKDMLDDHHVDPYTSCDRLIELGAIIADDRYTVLPNMRSRKKVFSDWSRDRIQALKQKRAQEAQKDPRIPYFALLESKATPKLYWPEFRRKYQKEPPMRNTKLSDKDREKWYREFISRLKLPESSLKADLISLLKSAPLMTLNRSSSMENLPSLLLTDLRYISLRRSIRDPLVEAHIGSLDDAPDNMGLSPEEEMAKSKEREERERRERALAERRQKVEDEKRRQRGALQHSKGMLREEEEEIERAMKFRKEGLKGHMEIEQDQDQD